MSSEEKKGEARVDIKKLDEIISKLDDIVKRLEKLNISEEKKKELVVTLEDTINELEDAVMGLESRSGVEELKEVGNLLRTLGDVARDVLGSAINKFIEIIDGKRLGENIAAFYNSLKSAGLPDQVVHDIVKEYTTRVLSSIPNIADLASKFLSVAEIRGKKLKKKSHSNEKTCLTLLADISMSSGEKSTNVLFVLEKLLLRINETSSRLDRVERLLRRSLSVDSTEYLSRLLSVVKGPFHLVLQSLIRV